MSDKAKSDTLFGIEAIASYVGLTSRQASYRSDIGQMPTFKLGRTLCASRSALDAWLAQLAAGAKVSA